VFPTGNVDPDAGLQTGTISPSRLSWAVALYLTIGPDELVACTTMSEDGTETIGAILSTIQSKDAGLGSFRGCINREDGKSMFSIHQI
jgi:hypothetical protein